MAFKISNFCLDRHSTAAPFKFQANKHRYVTVDTWAAVKTAGYFNTLSSVVIVNDLIEVIAGLTEDGAAAEGGVLRVSAVDVLAKTVTCVVFELYKPA